MSEAKITIAITGGGTGGHVYPAFAVIEELKKNPQIEFFWIGSKGGMEEALVSREDIPYFGILSGKLRRYFSFKNFTDLFKIQIGFWQALGLLRKKRPDVLFSKGGFVSVPPVLAARLLGIPSLTHESDYSPGLATRLNSRFVKKVFVPYKDTLKYFSGKIASRVFVTGNPVRRGFYSGNAANGREFLGIKDDRPVLLVMGGSSGALQLNTLTGEVLDSLTEKYFVVHQMGGELYKESDRENYYSAPYFYDELADILAATDLAVSRAGAGSLWELAASRTPAVLIPLGGASSRGDQVLNAEVFSRLGMAQVLDSSSVTSEQLLETVSSILDNSEILNKMNSSAEKIALNNGASAIAGNIMKEVRSS